MSCGSGICASIPSRRFAPRSGAPRLSFRLRCAFIGLGSMLHAMQRKQFMIELEKLRQRGLLSGSHLRFLSEVGLTHEQVERENGKRFWN